MYNLYDFMNTFPYICYALIISIWLFAEMRNHQTLVLEGPEAVEGGFIPPGSGYQYFVSAVPAAIYIHQRSKGNYRCYILHGELPHCTIKKDRHGRYFSVKCPDDSTAEMLIEQVYGG